MKKFIKVTNPLLKDELSKVGFSYISIEAGNLYVYEHTELLMKMIKQIDGRCKFDQPAYAIDNKLKF